MDKLDNLKDLWKTQEEPTITYSKEDILSMVRKKSTSSVKWILLISILEFLLPYAIIPFTSLDATKQYYQYGVNDLITYYTVFYFIVILGFIYVFYKNFRGISVATSVKNLLERILKTRKTVKYYIYFNITLAGIVGMHSFYVIFNSEMFKENLPAGANITSIWVISALLFALALFLFWCFYRLIYGFFLKKLQRNYKELAKKD